MLSGRGLCYELITCLTECGTSRNLTNEKVMGPRWPAALQNHEDYMPQTKLIEIILLEAIECHSMTLAAVCFSVLY